MSEFQYSNIEREMEVYGYDSFVKSHCRMCHGGCGVIIYIKDGKVASEFSLPSSFYNSIDAGKSLPDIHIVLFHHYLSVVEAF